MLTIRSEQIDALEHHRHEEFLQRLYAHLLKHGHARTAVGPPDDPMQMVDLGVAEAQEHGLKSERAIAAYVTLCVQYGLGLAALKSRGWFDLLKRDRSEPPEPEWIDRLCRNIDAFLQADQDREARVVPGPKYDPEEPEPTYRS